MQRAEQTALGSLDVLTREEVVAALEHRIMRLDTAERDSERLPVPDHVAEIRRLADARVQGERTWASDLLERVRRGDYAFAGERVTRP